MKHTGLICLFLLAILAGCSAGQKAYAPLPVPKEETVTAMEPEQEKETVQNELILMVNNTAIPVIWEENTSVAELREHAGRKQIQIEMSMYGGWEQVGSLGFSVSRKDVQTTAKNGDIMLYSGNQIVLFYGENSWAYTKLGHIDLPEEEVTALLGCGAVRITIAVQ